MKFLTISGSLRADSLNTRLLDAAELLLPEGAEVARWDRLAELPHYDQDLDAADPGAVVTDLRTAIERADALLIATPEFNGSVPGVLKNAIDWASRPRGAASLAGKPVLVLAASPSPRGAQWAREDLARILQVAGAEVVGEPVGVGQATQAFDGGSLVDEGAVTRIRRLLEALVAHTEAAA